MNKVLDTVKNVIANAKHVSLNQEAVEFFCKNNCITDQINWLDNSPLKLGELPFEKQLKFAILLNSISFCFWQTPKWTVEHKKRIYDGSWGMIAAFSKAISEGKPILDFEYLSSISVDDFKKLIENGEKISLAVERTKILRDVSSKMLDRFNGNPLSFVEESKYDAYALQQLILNNFECFSDNSIYKGEKIFFNKRAQLLSSDIGFLYKEKQKAKFQNLGELTACADYKIPYILREFAILNYSESLSKHIKERKLIKKDSEYEIEIRAFAIWGVEMLRQQYKNVNKTYNSNEINDYLWLLSQIKNPKYQPYHLTLTSSY